MDVELKAFLQRAEGLLARIEPLLPAQPPVIDWEHTLAARWQRDARSGYLAPLEVNLDLRLDDLIGIDRQRDLLAANTQQFVDGLPANHVLLWGARGTGKSSLIRALLAEYAGRGLRLIEIERDHLADLPRVVELLSGQRQAFVLFCDDLSMEALAGTVAERATAVLEAGCDVVLHCNGDLAEMRQVAEAAGKLKGRARTRAEAAMARIVRTPEPLDAAGAHARFFHAMTGKTDAARGPDVGEAQA